MQAGYGRVTDNDAARAVAAQGDATLLDRISLASVIYQRKLSGHFPFW
jgi:hypothetical protein